MQKKITFTNILLLLLSLSVLWLIDVVTTMMDVGPTNTVYMQNTDTSFVLLDTAYGAFPIKISESKTVSDRTEITLGLLNPFNTNFADAEISLHVGQTIETVTMNIVPNINKAKFKIPPIQRGEPIKITLKLEKISF